MNNTRPYWEDNERIALVIIDMQYDFVDPDGVLFVPGAAGDCLRLVKWIEKHSPRITKIYVSLDTHYPQQIFFPCWWENDSKENPEPFTIITAKDVYSGKWKPLYEESWSVVYLESLEKLGRNKLVVWPYHTLIGTEGHNMDPMLYHRVMIHSVRRQSQPEWIIKGNTVISEFYSIFEPEVRSPLDSAGYNFELADGLNNTYDKIYVSGQAKSHCVLESLRSMTPGKAAPELISKVHLLKDTTSSVVMDGVDFDKNAENEIKAFQSMGMKVVDTLEGI